MLNHGRPIYLGRWDTPELVDLAIDRAVLHFGLDRPLRQPVRARALGPASPEELKRLARLAYKARAASSRYHGVWLDKDGRVHAQIQVDGATVLLGIHDTEDAAALVVDGACLHHGLPVLNFPERARNPVDPDLLKAERHDEWKSTTTSEYSGVFYRPESASRPWFFYLWVNDHANNVQIGGYENERDAALARDRAALFYGAETTLNFPKLAGAFRPADFETLRAECQVERKKSYSSRYRGVCFDGSRGCWMATITVKRKHHSLGRFQDEEAAARAYDHAAWSLLPAEIAARKVNFPE